MKPKTHMSGRRFRPQLFVGAVLIVLFFFSPVLSAQDTISPQPPRLLYLTVEPPTGDVSLVWQASPDSDVAGYIIYRNTRDVWVAVDTLRDAAATTYRDLTAHAALFAEGYVVAAYDSALNLSPLSDAHTTNLLQASFDSCEVRVTLSWSGYRGWGDSLIGYVVEASVDDGPYQVVDTVGPAVHADTLAPVDAGRRYCMIVTALHKRGWHSLSNRRCVLTVMAPPPAYVTCATMEVSGEGEVVLTYVSDAAPGTGSYVLVRSLTPAGPGDTLVRRPPDGTSTFHFTDTPGDTLRHTLYYRLLAYNHCGREVLSSRPFTLLVPQIRQEGFLHHLSWARSLSYDTLRSYRLYRRTSAGGWTLLTTLTPSDTSYTDDVTSLQYQDGNTGEYCYRVEALGAGTSGTTEQRSLSWTVCITHPPYVRLPNAFTPNGDGVNDLFAPVFNHTPSSYHLVITDRWGTVLFETTDPAAAWDGRDSRGHPVPAGTYIVQLRAVAPDGTTIRRTAMVTVLFPR